MKNKWILLLSTILTITSCGMNETQLKQSINYEDGTLSINIQSLKQHHLICEYLDEVVIDTLFNEPISLNLEDLLDINEHSVFYVDRLDWNYKIAYSLITKGYAPIHINLDNKIDTIFTKRVELSSENNLYARAITGKICPIEKFYLSKKEQDDIREWLDEDKYVTAIDMGKMLTRMYPLRYIAPTIDLSNINSGQPIPILKNFIGQEYKIESNLDADNYYLYAPVDISDLNTFIQDMIENGFPASVKNLNSTLPCYRRKGEGGRFVIFLIGINNNGTYNYIPIGLVAIDNLKPDINKSGYYPSFNYIHNCNLRISNIIKGFPFLQESVTIYNGQFRGNDALFVVEFGPGIESISIKREIYHDYMRYRYRPETKTIKLSDKKSPYSFRYVLDLSIGDNYIPITVTDKCGNTTNYTYKITMEEAKDDD